MITEITPYSVVMSLCALLIQSIQWRTMCEVLNMRSNSTYYALNLAFFLSGLALSLAGAPHAIQIAFIAPFMLFILPVALSTNPLRVRVIRTFIVDSVENLAELIAFAVYALLSGGDISPTALDDRTVPLALITYAVIIAFLLPAMRITALILNRQSGQTSSPYPRVSIVFTLNLFLLVFIVIIRIVGDFHRNSQPAIEAIALPLIAFGALSLMLGLTAQGIVERDIDTRRRIAERAASGRQAKHLRAEILGIAHDAKAVQLLRHDIANQVAIVEELATSGCSAEADAYLAALQERAHRITKDAL